MRAILPLAFLLAAVPAFAQQLQPITLSAQEYAAIMQALTQRDPLMALLTQRQIEAQQEAAKEAAAAKAAAPPAPAKP